MFDPCERVPTMDAAPSLDQRLTPARPDLAALHLRGRVEAARFVEGRRMRVLSPCAPMRRQPRPDAPLDTEALHGEVVTVYEQSEEGWAWGQIETDGYVGYLPSEALAAEAASPTHRVAALRTFIYPGPSIKLPPVGALSLGSRLAVAREEGTFAVTGDGGFVFAAHLAPVDAAEPDFVAVAERFLGVPYLWGGRTSLGLDCSGLVQVALGAAGQAAPRDSDQQEAALGAPLQIGDDLSGLARGDLIFWRGHVGVMLDAERLLHANGHHMAVAVEPLRDARDRIRANSYGPITSARRLD